MTKMELQLTSIERQMNILSRIDDFEKEVEDFLTGLPKGKFDNNLYQIILLKLDIMQDYAIGHEQHLLNTTQANFRSLKGFWIEKDSNLFWESVRIVKRHIKILKQRLDDSI